jgi:hypothetical protein
MEGLACMSKTERGWLCPWCDGLANLPVEFAVTCDSRRCECGALGLGAPSHDTDEIIDDAINIFGIANGYMFPFDTDRVAGLQRIGVDVAEGQTVAPSGSDRVELRVLWFRRKPAQAT